MANAGDESPVHPAGHERQRHGAGQGLLVALDLALFVLGFGVGDGRKAALDMRLVDPSAEIHGAPASGLRTATPRWPRNRAFWRSGLLDADALNAQAPPAVLLAPLNAYSMCRRRA